MNPVQPIGSRLRVARENAGLSQEELAGRISVEAASVAAWENDEREPRANRLMMLCGVLDVSLRWVFEGVEDAHMAQDDQLPYIRGELDRLASLLAEVQHLVSALGENVAALENRQRDTDS